MLENMQIKMIGKEHGNESDSLPSESENSEDEEFDEDKYFIDDNKIS
jgi:hypothetical protein